SQIFSDLALAITFSLTMSLIVSVTFVPMVATRVRVKELSTTGITGMITRFQQWYARSLSWVLDNKKWVFGGILGMGLITLLLFFSLGREFMPTMDTGQIRIQVRLPYGTPVETTDSVATDVEALVAAIPEVQTIATTVSHESAHLFVDVG